MRSSDVRDDLADGIDAAPLPPMGPDGGPLLLPTRPAPPLPPRLCEAGPCARYHRLEIQMDAQNPMAEMVDGKLVQHARVFHTTTHHYCYPDVGIETNLGSLPVLACNRWAPVKKLLRSTSAARRAYDLDMERWHRDRDDEHDEAMELAYGSGVPVPLKILVSWEEPCQATPDDVDRRPRSGVVFGKTAVYAIEADPTWRLDDLITRVDAGLIVGTSQADERGRFAATRHGVAVELEVYEDPVERSGMPTRFTNLAATVSELGLEPDAKLTITIFDKEIA